MMKLTKKLTKAALVCGFFCMQMDLLATEIKKIGVTWLGQSQMPERVTSGFQQRLTEYRDQIELEIKPALNSIDTLTATVKKFEETKDAMLVLRSNGARFLAKNPPKIPTFIGACNHPAELGVIKNMKAPEGNVTGVSYYIMLDNPFDLFQQILPKVKSYVLLNETNHPSSAIDRRGTQTQCIKHKLNCHYELVSHRMSIKKAVVKYADKTGIAFIIGNQAKVLDNSEIVFRYAGNNPVLSYSEKSVIEGALLSLSANDVKLGVMLAESVIDVLIKGKKISQVPVKFDMKPTLKINTKVANDLKIAIPLKILNRAQLVD